MIQKDKNVKLTPIINTIPIGNSNVYKANSFVGNTNTGGNLASLKPDTDRTIDGNTILNIKAPDISSTHSIFTFRSPSLKNFADQNGNANPMNK